MKYVACWNMPGYLPEAEPAEFETFDEAKRYIIDELKEQEDRHGGELEDEDSAATLCFAAEEANLESGPFETGEMPDGYTYWVMEAEG